MFTQSLLFSLLLIILFLFSRRIINIIYKLVFIITLNHKISLYFLAFIILPGTIIHELSHFLMATILRVPTGTLSVFPTIEENGETRAGKLMLGKVDPFRQTIVGLAPMIIGLVLIYLLGKTFSPYLLLFSFTPGESIRLPQGWFALFALCYLLFITSITMFSSRKDLESLIIVGPIILLILTSLHIVGIRIFFDNQLIEKANLILMDLNRFLLVTAIINLFVFSLLNLLLIFWQKILKRKLKYS